VMLPESRMLSMDTVLRHFPVAMLKAELKEEKRQ
jgi:hypothetical protein